MKITFRKALSLICIMGLFFTFVFGASGCSAPDEDVTNNGKGEFQEEKSDESSEDMDSSNNTTTEITAEATSESSASATDTTKSNAGNSNSSTNNKKSNNSGRNGGKKNSGSTSGGSSGGSGGSGSSGGSSGSGGSGGSGGSNSTGGSSGGEFRGVWITYFEIANMLKSGVSSAKSQIDAVMKNTKDFGLNTVVFHVRANSDAYYKSSLFKSAANIDKLLNQGFDPLTYAVQAAHSKGLKIHAWVNPYRIGTTLSSAMLSGNDVFKAGNHYYYNPASEKAKKLVIDGVAEIVRNYDVDGVQFDDYFYPDNTSVLPRTSPGAFEKDLYNKTGGGKSIAEWRKSHVNDMIRKVYSATHSGRSGTVFGISPRAVISQNLNLYADTSLWMREKGYVDYMCPQIYYGFKNSNAGFSRKLAKWGALSKHSSVKLYVGLPLYKAGIADDEYAGTGRTEWANNSDILKRMVIETRNNKAYSGLCIYKYSDILVSGSSIKGKEAKNLKSILK